jgi:hypothetical protein
MAQWVRVLSRGELTGVDLTVVKSHGDATEVFGYVAQDRATAVHQRALRISTAAYRYGSWTCLWPELSTARIFV